MTHTAWMLCAQSFSAVGPNRKLTVYICCLLFRGSALYCPGKSNPAMFMYNLVEEGAEDILLRYLILE